MKLTAIILFAAALIIVGLMIFPKVIACIGMVIAMLLLIACCMAPIFIHHPACEPEDDLTSQPAKSESRNSANNSL